MALDGIAIEGQHLGTARDRAIPGREISMIRHAAFALISGRPLPDQGGPALHLRHRATGAEVVAVLTGDTNRLFAITFPTLPDDDTGVAHILEHLVFRGSRAFPMTRPFAGLLQGSLQTYLNATTGSDRTSFHLASRSDADLRNLIEVMLDALLRPLLRKADFEEEAWHLTLDEPRAGPRLGGIVLAEMQGHLAVPGNLLLEEARAALLPGTVYAKTYGGAPEAIPRLTHADLVAFHRRHYHPSLAKVFLWGSHDLEARLDQIDRHFRSFPRREPLPHVPAPMAFVAPRVLSRLTGHLPSGSPGLVAMGWGLSEAEQPDPVALELLPLLLGEPPDGIVPTALETLGQGRVLNGTPRLDAFRQPILTLGLEAVEPAKAGQVETALLDALDRISRAGPETRQQDELLDRLELRLRERVSGPRPRGLVVLDRIIGAWRHGADPIDRLDHAAAMARLRAALGRDRGAMGALIRRQLVNNPHRVTLSLGPDPAAARMGHSGASGQGLSLNARRKLVRRTAARRSMQTPTETPRSNLPVLSRSELPHQVISLPTQAVGQVLLMDLQESGLLRADLSMDLSRVPFAWLGYVPLLGRLMIHGLRDGSSTQLGTETWSRAGPGGSVAGLVVRGKSLATRQDDLLSRLTSLLEGEFAPGPHHVVAVISDEIARHEARLLSAGHQVVDGRLRAGSGAAGVMADRLNGLGQLAFLRRLKARVDGTVEQILNDLRSLRSCLVKASGLTVGLSGTDDPTFGEKLIATVADRGDSPSRQAREPDVPAYRREAHAIPLPLQAIGMAGDLRSVGFSSTGAARVGLCAISTGWLWDAVRVAGGAYGATATFDSQTGVASLLSFRDPHLLRTLDIFAESGGWLRRAAGSDLLDRAVIGAIAALDRPRPPDALALELLQRHLAGETDDLRQAELEAVLAATTRDLLDMVDALEAALSTGPVAILGSRAALLAALTERPGAFDLIEDQEVSDTTASRTAALTSG